MQTRPWALLHAEFRSIGLGQSNVGTWVKNVAAQTPDSKR
jgi:hypothetical protein